MASERAEAAINQVKLWCQLLKTVWRYCTLFKPNWGVGRVIVGVKHKDANILLLFYGQWSKKVSATEGEKLHTLLK
jgi:hypothetical protein